MARYYTSSEWEQFLGEQVRKLRLDKNIEMATLAEQAGISMKALGNLENGNGTTLKTLVKVLQALDATDWLEALYKGIDIDPIQLLKSKHPRQRARRSKVA